MAGFFNYLLNTMKYLSLLLTISITLGLSCTKPRIPEKPEFSRSVTYLRHHYGTGGKLSFIDTSIHWCHVAGAELARFESYDTLQHYICDTEPAIYLSLVIGPECKNYE